jgi:hypothetical protein
MRSWILLSTVLCLSCSDPLRDGKIEALGGEDQGFEPNEIHRPGQPCVACHSVYGGAEPEMSIAGTLFTDPTAVDENGDPKPLRLVPNHIIRLIDSEGTIKERETNRCGNFAFTLEEFNPAFPVRAELYGKGEDGAKIPIDVMASRIGREGSCGACHAHPATSQSPGVVYVPDGRLDPEVELPSETACPPPRFAPNQFNPNVEQ